MKPAFVVLLGYLLVFAGSCDAHEPGGQVEYLGNEGLLVSVCDTKILFDAFFDDDYEQYVLVPGDTRADILAGRPPYDGVDALFVSHAHGDHFSADLVLEYLLAHKHVVLFGPQQIVDALIGATGSVDNDTSSRIIAFGTKPGDPPEQTALDRLKVDVVAIPHAGGARMSDIDNLVFRVTVAGASTVMHFGDAAADDTFFARQPEFWGAMQTQAAFPPYWFLINESGRRILENRIRATQVVGVHVPANAVGNGDAWRQEIGADLFSDPGEARVVELTAPCPTG
ncbi:MAG: MBL fold metallo-hydrolase [Gammaproteobacteria bacterium]